jgi:uncharacterized oxidoreductase
MQFENKRILLTGGTDGIGLALARQLQQKDATVILVGRNPERCAAARTEGFEVIEADLSLTEGIDRVVSAVAGHGLDVLINNAGVSGAPNAAASCLYDVNEPVDLPAMDRAIFLNFHAPIHLITRLLPQLRARPEAMIVNVSSGLAIAPRSDAPVYCATKAGLRSFTLALRHQLRDTKVHVLEVLPPVVETKMTKGHLERGRSAITPDACATEIMAAMTRNATEANVGLVKWLRVAYSISPALARRVMIDF